MWCHPVSFGDTLYHSYGFHVCCSDFTLSNLCQGPIFTAKEENRSLNGFVVAYCDGDYYDCVTCSLCPPPPGGTAMPKRWGCDTRAPWSTWRERERESEIKKFRVTKRELLNNVSNIYKCKVISINVR